MKLKFLGTGAAEAIPALWCECELCQNAIRKGGKELRRRCKSAFLLLPNCDAENAYPAFDSYGHGAMTVDFDVQYTNDFDGAIAAMKKIVAVV